MKQKYLLLSMALFVFLLFYNLSSFAATCDLPGDFVGLMGDPTPDGKVDFNDLMVFATAYGSEVGDTNWNALCDICGYLGDPTPDGNVNFDDLMLFATNYGKDCPVHNITKGTYYNTIQAAIDDAVSENIIKVSTGTYYENINFMGKNIVLMSTDPKNPTVVTSTIIDGGKNGSVVTFRNSETNQARLEGFTIQNGRGIYEEEHTVRDGGGIFVDHSSPSIIGNIIVGNTAEGYGGGIAVLYGSSPTIIENTISGNTAEKYGGGISVWGSSPTITGNTISRNKSDNDGGGIFAGGGSSPIINNNSISGNTAEGYGGGIFITCRDSSPTITGNTISENTANVGGGVSIWWNFTSTITGNTISENTANVGGGIWVGESDPNINNNTISGNTAEVYGGGIYVESGAPTITGNTIRGNTATWGNGGGIYVGKDASVKTATGNEWLRNNVPPNKENTNTYSGNTHDNPPGYTEGADVYFETFPNETVYRAFLVGVGDYVEDTYDLPDPPYDVDRMDDVLSQCSFGPSNTQFSVISPLKDLSATKSAILQGIASVFSGSDDNDISYFYFSGHGYLDSGTNISYLCPTDTTLVLDLSTMISIDELETALSAIPGTKVVFIEACHSGGFIGKGEEEVIISKEELVSFNQEIINVFSQAQSKGLLNTNQYQVLTSCRSDQLSPGQTDPSVEGPFGPFTMALCEGGGYYGNYPADTNSDNKVSLNEAYLYVIDWVNDFYGDILGDALQAVQVYPNNSNFAIIEY